jgi:DNA-3-methyladenine glycosylase
VKLERNFFNRRTLVVARQLLGKTLVHRVGGRELGGRIVETEAYIGSEDQACHARFGEKGRARPLFGPPGHAYVYLIYGMYEMLNVVTEAEGQPAAILIRALEPFVEEHGRTDGPGRLCRTLGITRAHNELDLCAGRSHLWIEDRGGPRPKVGRTPRIGVEYAGKWAALPWRFIDTRSDWLSA